jgi:low temperature requirement protein LtrA
MSQRSLPGHARLRLAVPMVGRDPSEEHRASTPLELFFDLVFVTAVALASEHFHHGLAEGRVARSLVDYALVFFALWWAWVNFTWFASAYDTDDVVYRIFVFITMTGALILAAGIGPAFETRDYTIPVIGYVVMRIALVTQWVRAARDDSDRRATAYRYAFGVAVLQVGWVIASFLPSDRWIWAFVVLGPLELLVPVWAESASPTTWHAEHIEERYGLFMIIVLGESVLAASLAIQAATTDGGVTGELAGIAAGGLLILFSIWWLYFDRPEELLLTSTRSVYAWAYTHFLVFASLAAVGAGLSLAIEAASRPVELEPVGVGAAVAVPVAIAMLCLWAMYVRAADSSLRRYGVPVTAALVLAASATAVPVPMIGLLLTALLVIKVVVRLRADSETAA